MDNGPCRGPEGPSRAIATVKTMSERPGDSLTVKVHSSSWTRTAMDMLDKMDALWMDSLDGLNGRGAVLTMSA